MVCSRIASNNLKKYIIMTSMEDKLIGREPQWKRTSDLKLKRIKPLAYHDQVRRIKVSGSVSCLRLICWSLRLCLELLVSLNSMGFDNLIVWFHKNKYRNILWRIPVLISSYKDKWQYTQIPLRLQGEKINKFDREH